MPTISRNIFWSTVTSILQLYTGSIVFIVLAKLMPIYDFGILSFGFSLSALVVISCDFGFSLMIMKDYPQKDKGDSSYLSNSLWAKLLLSTTSGVIFFVYLVLFYKGSWLTVGGLYIAFAIISSFTVYLQALLRIQNKFRRYTESNIIYAISITLGVLFYWHFHLGLLGLVCLMFFARIFQLIWIVYLCNRAIRPFSFDWKTVLKLLRDSWSFGMHTVLGVFYFMIDTQIISLYLRAEDVALYQSVFRIVLILLLFSDIVTNVLLPYLSFKFYKNEDISELVTKLFLYMLIISCSMFLGFTSFKTEILRVLYTAEYLEAANLVLPFSIVVVLRTSSAILGNLLSISNKQVYRVITVGISLFISVVLNLIFIPIYGIIAAAWIGVVVHSILFGLYFYYGNFVAPFIQLFQSNNIILVTVTSVIYIVTNMFFTGNLGIIFSCTLLWLVTIFFIMNRDNNFTFLKEVLKEKGSG